MYRQARLLGVLLILQFLAMVGIGIWLFSRFDWNRALKITSGSGKINVQTVEGPWLEPLVQAILFAIYFLAPAVLLLLAGLGFLLLRRRGWMLASVAQALIMLACLFFYPDPRPVVRLPDHRLLHLDGFVPELSERAGCGPPQGDDAGGSRTGDYTWRMK